MRKMPPKHLQLVQKWVFLDLAPMLPTLLYFTLLRPTSLHIAPHHKRDLFHVKRKREEL
jgi:hypothetical protein